MFIELLTERYPGMRFWLLQRITATYMTVYLLILLFYFLMAKPVDYTTWMAFNSPWWWRILNVVFYASLCIHAWIGVRDVFRDYVPNLTLRHYLQMLVELMLFASLAWSIFLFWSI
jgi:succinate dehydrogenase / fumarate reductase membrane anchor subunit